MSDFLKKVNQAIVGMGKGPYDDMRTYEILTKRTEQTIKHCEQLRKAKPNQN